MQTGGKWVVAGMLALAAAASLGAWLWNYRHSERALAFWGPEHALRVRTAATVELWLLEPEAGGEETNRQSPMLTAAGRSYRALARKDLSSASGLIHARHALTDGTSFSANRASAGAADPPVWTHAVRFRADSGVTTVLFDFPARRILLLEAARPATVSARLADGWRDFAQRRLPREGRISQPVPAAAAPAGAAP